MRSVESLLQSTKWKRLIEVLKKCMAEHSLYHHTQLVIMNLPFPFLTMGHAGGDSDSDMASYINHLEYLMDGFERVL